MSRRVAAGAVLACIALGAGLVLLGRHGSADGSATPGPRSVASVDWGVAPSSPGAPGPRGSITPPSAGGSSGSAHTASRPTIDPGRGAVQLAISRLHVRATVTPVTTTGTALAVPLDPRILGWWSAGAKPGSDHGAVVVDGHINYSGVDGALSILPQTRPGDVVTISQGARVLRYVITAVHTYRKASGIPSDVFRSTGPAELNLITCGGPFDPSTRNYEDNIVAYAVPA